MCSELHSKAFIFVLTVNFYSMHFTEQLVLLHSEQAQGSWEDGNYNIINTLKSMFKPAQYDNLITKKAEVKRLRNAM